MGRITIVSNIGSLEKTTYDADANDVVDIAETVVGAEQVLRNYSASSALTYDNFAWSDVVTITSFGNLVSGTDDTIEVCGVTFTAQAGAATPGDATFQAASSNDATATSLALQINSHATTSTLCSANAVAADVTITKTGTTALGTTYTDNDTNVGATVALGDAATISTGVAIPAGAFVLGWKKVFATDFESSGTDTTVTWELGTVSDSDRFDSGTDPSDTITSGATSSATWFENPIRGGDGALYDAAGITGANLLLQGTVSGGTATWNEVSAGSVVITVYYFIP